MTYKKEKNDKKQKGRKSVCLITFSDFGLGRAEPIARAMKKMNLEVLVVTNRPVYSRSFKPIKDSLASYGIDALEVPLPRLPYNNIASRLIYYILFTFLSVLVLFKSCRKFDFCYSRGPQPFTDISCYILKIFKGNKIISDITDLWPDALEYVPLNTCVKRVLVLLGHGVNSLMWNKIDVIVTHNELMAYILSQRSGKKTHVIYGAIDLEKFKPMQKQEAFQKLPRNIREKLNINSFIILYAGLLGPFQNPEIILKLAQYINDASFVVIGTGPLKEKLIKEKETQKISNVIILDTVPNSLMPFVYNIADLFLFTYAPSSFLITGLPKKFIEYAACGRPIICITPDCVASMLCSKWKAGYTVHPEKLEDAVKIIRELKLNENHKITLGNNARRMAEKLFSIDNIEKMLREILN
ncbi:MAG: glycosyltransferase family 4 protein [Thermofilum sp.]|nr:glycosyltransferase family 4 protein [Thermofilum sp.]